jgi:hypothetical protein
MEITPLGVIGFESHDESRPHPQFYVMAITLAEFHHAGGAQAVQRGAG